MDRVTRFREAVKTALALVLVYGIPRRWAG